MVRRSLWGDAGALVAALSLLPCGVAHAQQSQPPDEERLSLELRLESDVLASSYANVGVLERLGVGLATAGKVAFIGGGYVGVSAASGATKFLMISPYAGARFWLDSSYFLDMTASYHQLVGLDEQLQPIAGGYLSQDAFGYGGSLGAALSLKLGKGFSARVSCDVGGATFDYDRLYLMPPSVMGGYHGGPFVFGGLGLVGHLGI